MEIVTTEPRFLKPPAVDKRNPKVLLWMDVEAIKEKTRIETESTLPILIETELTEDIQEGPSIPHYPIKPSTQTVGEYKVTPAIHAGYAVTWFGLFGAGVIMTRKLITKGR
jgi:cytochrome oxidase assembly protein ShyY1